ncbi:hypothetical protein FEM48_Zijuj12G0014700 [Ziziphus jujuba var. spinosa]|uniref:Flavonoid 3',5'-hydroxylase 2-like n=1 Tax=Ziziphus jujuba var. spinosa TaxID=714518 RepID=A0A978UAE5_ZIZJJ|nr:hypothetical protein FEM48_Zijuj12G0014700 [Ziziphus jujuba var. spinosa]
MLLKMLHLQALVYATIFFIITHILFRSVFLTSNQKQKLPPGPKGWPVIGCLPLVGSMPHVSLAQMAEKYGPIMFLKMGTCGMVVVSKPNSARAFLKTLDENFSNRPLTANAKYITYGGQDSVTAMESGTRWKLLKKLSNLHMLGATSFKDWSPTRAMEVRQMVQEMHKMGQQGQPIAVMEMVFCAMANMITQKSLNRRVFGKQGSEGNSMKDMIIELMRLAGLFNIGDFIPSIAWLDIQGTEGQMKRHHKKFDALLTKMLEEHEQTAHLRTRNPDFIDVVMANRECDDGSKHTFTNIKALLLFKPVRRMCAGIRMGIALVECILGTLVHAFEWHLPGGTQLNMDEKFGLVLQRADPLVAGVVPRLQPCAYD